MSAILKAIRTAWREGVREYKRQKRRDALMHVGDPFQL